MRCHCDVAIVIAVNCCGVIWNYNLGDSQLHFDLSENVAVSMWILGSYQHENIIFRIDDMQKATKVSKE